MHDVGWILYLFAAFLIYTGIKMLIAGDEEADIGKNRIVRAARQYLRVTDNLHGRRFFVRLPDANTGKRLYFATPLFLSLVVVELVVAEPVEALLTDAVLTRLDSRDLAKVLAGKASPNHDVAALAAAVEADQTRLDELAGLYADGAISAVSMRTVVVLPLVALTRVEPAGKRVPRRAIASSARNSRCGAARNACQVMTFSAPP